jgi:hypothetical protein
MNIIPSIDVKEPINILNNLAWQITFLFFPFLINK